MENYAKVKLRPSTFKTSQGFLKNHIKPQIGSVPLADLTSLDLQRFYKHLLDGGRVDRVEAKKKPKGLAPKTVRNIHQMIGSAYNLAMEQKLVSRNPTQGCALPKVEHKEMKTLTADQLSAFFQEAKDSGVYELYYLDLATGLRRGELLGLKWTDVDLCLLYTSRTGRHSNRSWRHTGSGATQRAFAAFICGFCTWVSE